MQSPLPYWLGLHLSLWNHGAAFGQKHDPKQRLCCMGPTLIMRVFESPLKSGLILQDLIQATDMPAAVLIRHQ